MFIGKQLTVTFDIGRVLYGPIIARFFTTFFSFQGIQTFQKSLQHGEKVLLEFDFRNWLYPGPVNLHDNVATLTGSDKAGEIVKLGAHLASFDGGTCAA